jgi:SAM-dependent methyltransferase
MTQPKKFDRLYYSTGSYQDHLEDYYTSAQSEIETLLKRFPPNANYRFLDIGCGLGGWVLHLRKLGLQAFGVEVSPFSLENSLARKWIIPASILNIPFQNQSFDVVISKQVLYYLSPNNQQRAAGELTRIASKWIYFDTISSGTLNENQEENPDSLRNNKFLLSGVDNIKLFESRGFKHMGNVLVGGFETDPAEGLYKSSNSELLHLTDF